MSWLRNNRIAAALIAFILLGVAVRGFTGQSQSPAYDTFHLIFGLFGIAAAVAASGHTAPLFNLIFGLLDGYQAIAQVLGLFPTGLFNLTAVDTAQHIVVALMLLTVSVIWFVRSSKPPKLQHIPPQDNPKYRVLYFPVKQAGQSQPR